MAEIVRILAAEDLTILREGCGRCCSMIRNCRLLRRRLTLAQRCDVLRN